MRCGGGGKGSSHSATFNHSIIAERAAQGLMTLATLTDLDSKISPTSKCLLHIAVYFVEAVTRGETKSSLLFPL